MQDAATTPTFQQKRTRQVHGGTSAPCRPMRPPNHPFKHVMYGRSCNQAVDTGLLQKTQVQEAVA